MRHGVWTVVGLAMLVTLPVRAQDELTTQQLVDRAADWVHRFVQDFANVVAEESMRQESRGGPRRQLKSDFLLVKHPGEDRLFLAFRDVTEVNGRPVRDQQDRLTKLFMQPWDDAIRRASEIASDASRHSIIALGPETSPFAVIAMLQPLYQQDYTYRLRGREKDGAIALRTIEMVHKPPVQPNSAIAIPPVTAKAVVEEATGRVRQTEMQIGRAPNTRLSKMTFRFDAALGMDVPAELRHSPYGSTELTATYAKFRRFQVRTDEVVDPGSAAPTNP